MPPVRAAHIEGLLSERPGEPPEPEFSLVRDPVLRLLRMLRLVPERGLGVVRRIVVLVLITWVPIMVWAALSGQLQPIQGESVIRHLGVHVRCLLAIPLLVLAEPTAERYLGMIVGNFHLSGLVRPEDRAAFTAILHRVERLRDAKVVWGLIVGIVVAVAFTASRMALLEDYDALAWGQHSAGMDFGAMWALYVGRPIFLFLVLSWFWRLALTWILFGRLARLELQLVAPHPDRVGGLGFLQLHTLAFNPVVLALSSVFSVAVAHRILAHGAHIKQFQAHFALLILGLVILFLLPLTAFARRLWRLLMLAQFQYGTLAGRHVRGLHARWVDQRKLEDDILSAPEIGPAADVATLYGMGTKVLLVPLGKLQVASLILAAAVPPGIVAALQVPFKDVIDRILKMIT